MGRKKKIFKADDITGEQVEDTAAEALEHDELDEPATDDAGALDEALKPDDEPKADEPASGEHEPKTVSFGDAALPAITDTSDLSIKDDEGKLVEGTETPMPPAPEDAIPTPGDKPEMDVEADKPADQDLGERSPEHASLPDDSNLVKTQLDEAEDADEPGLPESAQEAAEVAEQAAETDPSTMPGMAPTQAVGLQESLGNSAPALTVLDGLSKGDDVPPLSEVHEAAKPVAEAIDDKIVDSLKDAGNAASEAIHGLKGFEAEFSGLTDEGRQMLQHLRAMGLHFIGALEQLFKRG